MDFISKTTSWNCMALAPTAKSENFFTAILKLTIKYIEWGKRLVIMALFKKKPSCHSTGDAAPGRGKKVALVGNPNVGKSVLFNALTGAYVTVSNYPGTSVEVARGSAVIEGEQYEIIDTPEMYSILPITEEERVAREILLNESPDVVIHVLDARNLERMLAMTLQLIEAGLPVVLVVNIMDEAERM